VRRECEAQGETVTRRGYSRRSTVMNSWIGGVKQVVTWHVILYVPEG
jgi:hypothetical protein